ncbi:MAG: hypothetical protein R6X20_03075 [Phycisphaerae bacterium]
MSQPPSAAPSPDRSAALAHVRSGLAEALARARPASAEALWYFVLTAYGLAVPRRAVCPEHQAPFDYLVRAVLKPGRDLVVWACRGGAKTELGALAAHLDSILRPGCQTRILGGSLDQSEKMYEYLVRKWEGPFAAMLAREPTARRTELVNGSAVEVLTQSPRSVRGQRVHRLKCDEVDEFSPEVWRAAQFVTQSGRGRDGAWIPAQMEVFSTMHRPFGPMAALVDRLEDCGLRNADSGLARSGPAEEGKTRPDGRGNPKSEIPNPNSSPLLLKWCLWDVIERCPPARSCSRCPLWPDCGGKARRAEGYFPIADAIAQQARASRPAWESEMLCLRPRTERLVFSEFDAARHVAPVAYDASLPLYRTLDFGYANPFVCLWVQVEGQRGFQNSDFGLNGNDARLAATRSGAGSRAEGGTDAGKAVTPAARGSGLAARGPFSDVDLSGVRVRVLAEYVERERAIADHARAMAARDPGPVVRTYADPAGWQRSDVTGTGPCEELARLGIRCRTPRAGILEGIELVRRLLKVRPDGSTGLVINPSCEWLLRALATYRWEETPDGSRTERPAKDGADHPMDALRYLVTGLFLGRDGVRVRKW